MSTIAAGTTSGTALVSTGNTDGTLQLQVNGTTPALTLNTSGAVGVGSTPGYGTSGQVLTSGGSSAAPTWAAVSGGLTLITTVTASSSATALVETGIDSTYDNNVNLFNGDRPASNASIYVQLKIGGSYQASWYRQNQIYLVTGGSITAYTDVPSQIYLSTAAGTVIGSQAGSTANGEFWLFNPSNSAIRPSYKYSLEGTTDTFSTQQITYGGGIWDNGNGAVTGVKFYASTGNINGTFRLYGYKNS